METPGDRSRRTSWHEEYDIVIVGFDIASCSAAIEGEHLVLIGGEDAAG